MEDNSKCKPGPNPETLKVDIPLEDAVKWLVTPKQNRKSEERRDNRR